MRRNRLISFLLMPIAVFLWILGWALCWLGVEKAKKAEHILNISENNGRNRENKYQNSHKTPEVCQGQFSLQDDF